MADKENKYDITASRDIRLQFYDEDKGAVNFLCLKKIKVKTNTVVEIDGDEMTGDVADGKRKTSFPYLDMDIDYYDLYMKHRDDTDDQVTVRWRACDHENTVSASNAPPSRQTKTGSRNTSLKKHGRAPTVHSPPCWTDGFQKTDSGQQYQPNVSSWKKPIIIGRHAYGDVYNNFEMAIPGAGKLEIVFYAQRGRQGAKHVRE